MAVTPLFEEKPPFVPQDKVSEVGCSGKKHERFQAFDAASLRPHRFPPGVPGFGVGLLFSAAACGTGCIALAGGRGAASGEEWVTAGHMGSTGGTPRSRAEPVLLPGMAGARALRPLPGWVGGDLSQEAALGPRGLGSSWASSGCSAPPERGLASYGGSQARGPRHCPTGQQAGTILQTAALPRAEGLCRGQVFYVLRHLKGMK